MGRTTLVLLALAVLGACNRPREPAPRAKLLYEDQAPKGDLRLYSAVAADLDGDGKAELIAAGFAAVENGRRSMIPIYQQKDGAWTVLAEADWTDGAGSTMRNVEVADLDGDGAAEIIALGRVGETPQDARARMAILGLRSGKIQVLAETTWLEGEYTHGFGLGLGDLDGDASIEIVTGGFQFDGKRERGFVRVWSFSAGALAMRRQTTLDGEWAPSLRVNAIAVGDLDGDQRPEIVVAGRRGALKTAALKADHALRTEEGILIVLDGNDLKRRAQYAWRNGTTTRLRTVALGDLDGDGAIEVVAGGQYDADGKAWLGLFAFRNGELVLVHDASTKENGPQGEIKDLIIDGDRVLATGPAGAAPARQGNVEAWRLRGGELVREAAIVSKNADETRSRAAVVVPSPDGVTVITVGHGKRNDAIVGQVLGWDLR